MIDKELTMTALVDGLDKFRTGATYSRLDVFPNNEVLERQSQRRILDHLVAAKILSKQEIQNNDAFSTVFKMRNADELETLLDSDEKLHRLLWPHMPYKAPAVPFMEPPAPPEVLAKNDVPLQEDHSVETIKPAALPIVHTDPEVKELLERLCLLFDAAMDTIILTRDKTIEMGKEIAKLRKDLGG